MKLLGVLALAACSGGTAPGAVPTNAAPGKGIGGIVLWVEESNDAEVVRWRDFDRPGDGTLETVTKWRSAQGQPTGAHWMTFETTSSTWVMIEPRTGGAGVNVTKVPSLGSLVAISPDNTMAMGCSNDVGCGIGPLSKQGLGATKPIEDLNNSTDYRFVQWLPDGRILYWHRPDDRIVTLDAATVTTSSAELPEGAGMIVDGRWTFRSDGPFHPSTEVVISWGELTAPKQHSFKVDALTASCEMMAVTHDVVCAIAPPEVDGVDRETQPNRLVVLDFSTGAMRELATDLAEWLTLTFPRSPDGRFVAVPVRVGAKRQLVAIEVATGTRTPISEPVDDLDGVRWLAR